MLMVVFKVRHVATDHKNDCVPYLWVYVSVFSECAVCARLHLQTPSTNAASIMPDSSCKEKQMIVLSVRL